MYTPEYHSLGQVFKPQDIFYFWGNKYKYSPDRNILYLDIRVGGDDTQIVMGFKQKVGDHIQEHFQQRRHILIPRGSKTNLKKSKFKTYDANNSIYTGHS